MTDSTQQQASQEQERAPRQEFVPPATQADLDRIIADRLSRERAKYGDYEELKAKADKFDEATEAVARVYLVTPWWVSSNAMVSIQ